MIALSCIIPCYGRPQRTLRAIECIIKQNFRAEWEGIFIGDGCGHFQKFINDGTFGEYSQKFPQLTFKNLEKTYGGWGTMCRREGIEMARGRYIIFLDNDDIILPNHFENYYRFMTHYPNLDMGYFNSYIDPWKQERNTYIGQDAIGHSEIIVKANVLKKEYECNYEYGHDWFLIKKLIEKGYKYAKCKNPPSYIIKGVGDSRETGID